MKIEKFIKDYLSNFTDKFKDLKISYYKSILSESHILLFESNSNISEEIEELQADLLFEVLDIYESESIVFTENIEIDRYVNLLYQSVGEDFVEFDWSSYIPYSEENHINVENFNECRVVEIIPDYYYALAA